MTTLPRRALGRTGLEVTSLSYGAMELRGTPAGPEVSDEQAERVLNATLDAGINFIDTAPDYGRSEERIGASIARRRAEYFLASKCGCVPGVGMSGEHVHTAENIRAGVEQSLRRDRKSTRLNSSHTVISYAVFCLKKKRTPSRHRVRREPRRGGAGVRGQNAREQGGQL